ncbi:YqgE/AlgH family protein [soil metagenome]
MSGDRRVSPDGARWWVGQLLVATPALEDPNFRRTVILLLDHDEDGALGVALDRPLEPLIEDVLPGWEGLVGPPGRLFAGGPVSKGAALGVAVLDPATPSAPLGWRRMFGDTGLVDLDTPVPVVADAIVAMRVFAGYSGWGPGQLEVEVADGSWLLLPAEPDDLISADPSGLWRRVWRRQGGWLGLLADFPEDPAHN